MGKIKVDDLARMMNIPAQDLLFKLRAIGVRVDEDDPRIDAEIIQAILAGKKLPSPREVILRDGETQAAPPPRRRPTGRRMPPPPRPSRRRPAIHKVEPRIKTIPVTERPAAPPSKPAEVAPGGEHKSTEAQKVARREPEPAPAPGRPDRSRGPRPTRPEVEPEDLRGLRGSVEEVEEAAAGREAGMSRRGRRRAERKRQEKESGARVLKFKQAAPTEAVTLTEGITVREFAEKLGVKAKDLIKILFDRGVMATINHVLEVDLAQQIASELGVQTMLVSFEEEIQLEQEKHLEGEETEGSPRSPVVTIMGHVDHGKTTLLDSLRSSKVVESEFGGITQHIGAYQVVSDGQKVVFLDTPGHEAFTLMRARGARVTDIVVLVVAADDGVMPQTLEALDHAKAAEVPIIIAINKMDRENADPERVKKELADRGLMVEEWGGETIAVPISALNGDGLPELLEMIALTADILELKANPELSAQGVVIEARKEPGRGILATVLVQNGSLRGGDIFVTGATWGRVRSMTDDRGGRVDVAGPATPIEVSGFNELPEAGDLFQVVEDESKARSIADFRQQELRQHQLGQGPGKVSLEMLFEQIQQGTVKELPVVLKADVQGSVEVLTDTLRKLSTDQVKVEIIGSGVGAITTNDVLLASASNAIVVGFNVRPERKATELADRNQVDIRLHTVIYELSDEMRKAMTGLLEPTFREVSTGRAEVRETFKVPKFGNVAGCHVIEGVIPRSASARLLRDNVVVHEGKIAQLKRFKDDAAEVRSGFDCGIRLEKYQDYKPGDTIEAFVQEEVAPTL
jgi:translation initiation factor IF-2